ncbi:Uncharacterised protein [Moraxella ovis]|uniref:Uncharacterized protein n=2 Tax=Moraxella ovis TaxID=29433 RepID=A0A378PL87_9GAMM|nr:hypothetical protein [Moraxella ovis]STY87511.1 Uncharacterised protein [Moraxella ovis]
MIKFILATPANAMHICPPCNLAKNSLAKSHELGNNTATTKLSAVKPNRHTLAIFTPNTQATPANTAPKGCVSNFVGLIVQNTIALVVNMHSRLITVVETQRPIFGAYSLTKLSGANMQNFLVGILAKLSNFTPAESLVISFIVGLPMACLAIGFLSVMGV